MSAVYLYRYMYLRCVGKEEFKNVRNLKAVFARLSVNPVFCVEHSQYRPEGRTETDSWRLLAG